jgi:hypothetical protein
LRIQIRIHSDPLLLGFPRLLPFFSTYQVDITKSTSEHTYFFRWD